MRDRRSKSSPAPISSANRPCHAPGNAALCDHRIEPDIPGIVRQLLDLLECISVAEIARSVRDARTRQPAIVVAAAGAQSIAMRIEADARNDDLVELGTPCPLAACCGVIEALTVRGQRGGFF